jgi:hypothetical protein
MSNRYYGGGAENLGVIASLPQVTFRAFVLEVLGNPTVLGVTREKYAKLTKENRDAAKRGPYFTACTFQGGRRLKEEAGVCNLIVLDLDAESSAMAGVYLRDPDSLTRALTPYSFAAYTTTSHTPTTPRMRIVVAADAIPTARYNEAVCLVARLLALPMVNRETLIYSQAMYMPSVFAGEDTVVDHPLVHMKLDGREMGVADLADTSATAPLPGVSAPTAKRDEGSFDLEFLQMPVEGVTFDDARSALEVLDPDMPYADWLCVAAALRHQFPFNEDEAYELFDGWSKKGKKYAGERDTFAKWASLRPTPRGRKPVTFRTIVSLATKAGWSSSVAVVGRIGDAARAWLKDPKRSVQELMLLGARKVASIPGIMEVERAALINGLLTTLRAKGVQVNATAIKRDIERFSKIALALPTEVKPPQAEDKMPMWLRGCTYVAALDSFLYRHSERKYSVSAFDRFFSLNLVPDKLEEGEPAKPIAMPHTYALNVARIPRVDRLEYAPHRSGSPFFARGDLKVLNSYLPTYPEPESEGADEAGQRLENHVLALFDREYATPLLDWMCYCVQNPGVKIRWAPLLQGAQGCGKTLLANVLETVLGNGNVRITDAHILFTSFTGWAEGAQIVVFEEVRVVGSSRYEVLNKLKPVVTNDTVTVHLKGVDAYQCPNVSNYLLLTNHQDALPIGENDRRYYVLFAKQQTRKEVIAQFKPDYFNSFFTLLKNNPGAFRYYLLNRKISSDFSPDGAAPSTPYLGGMYSESASPTSMAIRDAYQSGEFRALMSEDCISLQTAKALAIESGGRDSGQACGGVLRDLGFEHLDGATIGGVYHRFYFRRGSSLALGTKEDRRKEIVKLAKMANLSIKETSTAPMEDIL